MKLVKRWQKWLLGILVGAGLLLTGLVVVAETVLNERSLQEGLSYLFNNDVYSHGAARQKLETYINEKSLALTQAQVYSNLEHGLNILGDKHYEITYPDDDIGSDESDYTGGVYVTDDGYILAHMIDASPQARQLKRGDKIIKIDGLPFEKALPDGNQKARTFVVQRGQQQYTVTVPYHTYQRRLEAPSWMVAPHIGYYLMPGTAIPDLPDEQVESQNRAYVQQQADALAHLKQPICGLIVDLRLNWGGTAYVMAKAGSLWLGTGGYGA